MHTMTTKNIVLIPLVLAIAAGTLVPGSAALAAREHAQKATPHKAAKSAHNAAPKPA